MPESEFEAMADADDEEHTASPPKSWYKCEFEEVHFKKYKHPKDKTHHTCEECCGFGGQDGQRAHHPRLHGHHGDRVASDVD